MKYVIDHDYHIHSMQSLCSGHPEQTPENILAYAQKNGLKRLVLTDHFWDETVPGASNWYKAQDYAHIARWLPLPQAEGVKFCFGCETDMNKQFTVGVSPEMMEKLDFVIIPTTHLHMMGFTLDEADGSTEGRAALWVKRFRKLLEYDLPKRKTGLAHMTDGLIYPREWEDHIRVLDLIPDTELRELFSGAAEKEIGIELNMHPDKYSPDQLERVMRYYFIAKECGCRFYLGSDSHNPGGFAHATDRFRKVTEYLGLEEEDKFRPACFD